MRQEKRGKNTDPDLPIYSNSDLFTCLSNSCFKCVNMCACVKAGVHAQTRVHVCFPFSALHVGGEASLLDCIYRKLLFLFDVWLSVSAQSQLENTC